MLRIAWEQVSKVFPPAGRTGRAVVAVDNVSCAVEPGEMFFLLGPSGCGKTTLLRILAGFVDPSSGRMLLDGRDVTYLPAEKRRLAMVFQSYALWPHMTVARNVEFGPRTAGWDRARRKEAVDRVLAMVGMEDRRQYKPAQLSGGQQQRVALARALAANPPGLLMDEPLSNLDARLRARMREEIRRIVKDSGATAVYVTHDQEEAFTMADRIAVMDAGRIVQLGTPQEIYRRPVNRFVADFLGEANFLEGAVAAREGQFLSVQTPAGPLRVRCEQPPPAGTKVTCCIRPEALRLRAADAWDNKVSAQCCQSSYLGHTARFQVRLPSGQSLAGMLLHAAPPQAGETVEVHFSPDDVVILSG